MDGFTRMVIIGIIIITVVQVEEARGEGEEGTAGVVVEVEESPYSWMTLAKMIE